MAALPSGGGLQLIDLIPFNSFDALDHELRDSVTAENMDGCCIVEIDDDHLDLPR